VRSRRQVAHLKILHACHDFLPRHKAGAELYAFHLASELGRRHDVAILCAEYDPSRAHGEIVRRNYEGLPVYELINNWSFRSLQESYCSEELNARFEALLDEVQPDVLHLHSLLNLSFDLPGIASSRGIPVVATLHDYTLVCPSGGQRMHVAERFTCDDINPERCARCFRGSPFYGQMSVAQSVGGRPIPGPALRLARAVRARLPQLVDPFARLVQSRSTLDVTPKDVERRLSYLEKVYRDVDLFVAPSKALGEECVRLGMPAQKLRVSDYGFPDFCAERNERNERNERPAGPLRIGFVGTLVWHKGVHVLVEAARRLPQSRFELVVYGDLETFPDYTAALKRLGKGCSIRFMGGFKREEAAAVYQDLDTLVVPSLWPENSPLVIHEAYQAGIPVVGARVGGIPGLVDHDRNGLLYDAFDADALAAALMRLIEEPQLLKAFADGLPAVKTIAHDAEEWEGIYRELASQERSGRGVLR